MSRAYRITVKESDTRRLKAGDGARVKRLRASTRSLAAHYVRTVGAAHPSLQKLQSLLHFFPGLVVPLELRESSDLLMEAVAGRGGRAIIRMLDRLAALSRGGEPTWYARGFIISMATKLEHVRAACTLSKRALGARNRLRIAPGCGGHMQDTQGRHA